MSGFFPLLLGYSPYSWVVSSLLLQIAWVLLLLNPSDYSKVTQWILNGYSHFLTLSHSYPEYPKYYPKYYPAPKMSRAAEGSPYVKVSVANRHITFLEVLSTFPQFHISMPSTCQCLLQFQFQFQYHYQYHIWYSISHSQCIPLSAFHSYCNGPQCNAKPFNAIPRNAMLNHTMLYHAMQCYTLHYQYQSHKELQSAKTQGNPIVSATRTCDLSLSKRSRKN